VEVARAKKASVAKSIFALYAGVLSVTWRRAVRRQERGLSEEVVGFECCSRHAKRANVDQQ
jgi:hypothetical protein